MNYSRPAFAANLLKSTIYDCDVINFKDQYVIKEAKKIILHPLETANYLEICNKKQEYLIRIPYAHIQDIKIDSEAKGFFKKSDKFLSVTYLDNNQTNSIAIDVDDKYVDEIYNYVIRTKSRIPSFWQTFKIEYNIDGTTQQIDVYSEAPFLTEAEDLIWYDQNLSGIINKNLKVLFAVTNFRIILYDFENSKGSIIPLSQIDDVVVMNRRTVSDSVRTGTFVGGGRIRGFGGVSVSYGKGLSKVLGDLVFMVNGQDVMRWGSIADPTGVSRMIKSVIKELYPKKKIRTEKPKTTKVGARDTPLTILKKRLANGEISIDEFERLKNALE